MAVLDTGQKLVFLFILMLTELWTEFWVFCIQFQIVKMNIWVQNDLQLNEGYL